MSERNDAEIVQDVHKFLNDHHGELMKMMHMIAYDHLKNEHDTQDAIGDAYRRIYSNIEKLRGRRPESIVSYIKKAIDSASKDIYRKNRTRSSHLAGATDNLTDPDVSFLDTYEKIELKDALKRLPDELLSVLFDRYYNGMTVKEIAEKQGVKEITVYKRLERAISQLRNILGEGADEK